MISSKKPVFRWSLVGAAIVTITSYAYGHPSATLFCANANSESGWARWDKDSNGKDVEPPSPELTTSFTGNPFLWAHNDAERTIRIGGIHNHTRWKERTLSLTDNHGNVPTELPSPEKAKEICDQLVELCTKRFGPDYKFIGGGGVGGSVLGWNSVSMGIINYGINPWGWLYTCPAIRQLGITSSERIDDRTYKVVCLNPDKKAEFFLPEGIPVNAKNSIWVNSQNQEQTFALTNRKGAPASKEDLDAHVGTNFCRAELAKK